ncbi:hypothetical protein PspLS_11917 [Pyricularia sp. CBS 133598]|nr:hypothetical protein PspLS_11917 [Pyricularia sp. CBS 133598]
MEHTRDIIEKANVSLIVCSPECAPSAQRLNADCIVVNKDAVAALPSSPPSQFPVVRSSAAAYVTFTSGTTGQPKAVVIEHGAFCTAAAAQANDTPIGPISRCLQFSSSAFDVSLLEIITPLLTGACVYMAREQDMLNNLPIVFREMKVTLAVPTTLAVIQPSFLRALSSQVELAPIKTLFMGGEALSQKDIDNWADVVHLANLYGTTNCSVAASPNPRIARSIEACNIGHPMGCAYWVVEPANRSRLVPIGAYGELLIEGSILSRGYLDDPIRTAGAFISGLAWAQMVGRTSETRFYATGDLVRQNPDGSLAFIYKNDSRLKIRGQPIESDEIQRHLAAMDQIRQSIVLGPRKGPMQGTLVVVLELKKLFSGSGVATENTIDLVTQSDRPKAIKYIKEYRKTLSQLLPGYMIPSIWIAVQEIPRMISSKLRISAVQAWVENMDDKTYQEMLAASDPTRDLDKNETIAIQISRRLASILDVDGGIMPTLAGKDFALTQHGMDSIMTISLSSWVRKTYGVNIPISVFLSNQTSVRTLAALVAQEQKSQNETRPAAITQPKRAQTPPDNLRTEFFRLESTFIQMQNEAPRTAVASVNRLKTLSTFFVTGSTGFLGSQIVKQLLFRNEVAKIICLVRANSDTHAWKRMMDVAIKGFWWRHDMADRLVVWRGDLSKPRLGLDDCRWSGLSNGEIDAVIHNGAVVHWYLKYEDVRAANVDSTLDILFALTCSPSPPPRFTYVSGGYFGAANETDEHILDLCSNENGYTQSKLISEMLVRRYDSSRQSPRKQSSLFPRCVVVKPGLIIGDVDHGVCNINDLLWRIVAAAIRVGGYNADEASDPNAWLLVAGSDQVATAIVDSCILPNSPASFVENGNVSGNGTSFPSCSDIRFVDGIPVGELWRLLSEELGFQLRPMSHGEWVQALEEDLKKQTEGHSLFPVAEFVWANEGRIGIQQFKDEKPVCSQDDILKRLKSSLLYLKSVGFFEAGCNEIPEHVFNRSGWKTFKTEI